MCELWDQLLNRIVYFKKHVNDLCELVIRFLTLAANYTKIFDYQTDNSNCKMQCNLIYLIINLLFIYKQQIAFAYLDDISANYLYSEFTSPANILDESTEKPKTPPQLDSPPNSTTEELGLQISKILNGFFASGYDKRVRPNYAKPVEVGVTMFVISISSVSEVQMDFTSDFYFRQMWRDPRLSFPVTNGISQIFVGAEVSDKIWVPDTFFANEKSAYFHIATAANTFLRINSDGEVLRSIRLTVTASCSMDLQYFPMDRQMCAIEIESYGYSMADIKYRWAPVPSSVGLAKELSLPQFDVLGHRQNEKVIELTTGNYSRLICEIQFARSLGFYLIQIYIPASLIVVISWVSFWLHRNATPARVSLGVTTVLTMTTLMSSTNAQLPKISYIKSIDVFLGTCFVMVFGSLLEYAVVGYFGKRISMRKLRNDQSSKAARTKAVEDDQANKAQGSQYIPAQMPMYNQPTIPYSPHPSMLPFNQHPRSPTAHYLPQSSTSPNIQQSPNRQQPPTNMNGQAPNIRIENINNESIYNENGQHPPSLPSLPSSEHPAYRSLQPRSHSADNYIYNRHLTVDPQMNARFFNPNYPVKYDNRSPPSKFMKHSSHLPFRPDYYHYFPPYTNLPFYHYPYSPYPEDPYNDYFVSRMSPANASSHMSYHQPSMPFQNKFNHYPYYYHPNYMQPFYSDYHYKFHRPIQDPYRRYFDYESNNGPRYPDRLNTTQLSVYNPSIQESRYSKYASLNKANQSSHGIKKSKSSGKDEEDPLLLHDQFKHEKYKDREMKNQLINATNKSQKMRMSGESKSDSASLTGVSIKQRNHEQTNLLNIPTQMTQFHNAKSLDENQSSSPLNHPVNHQMMQSMNQPMNQSMNQSMNQPINQQINQPMNQPMSQSMSQSMNQSMNQTVNQENQSLNQQADQLISPNQSMNQSINATMNSMKSLHSNRRIKSMDYEPLNSATQLTTQLTSNHKTAITATSTRRGHCLHHFVKNVLMPCTCTDPNKICGLSPSDIDKYSRVIFPVCFICFNLMYWIIYLHISTDIKADLVPLGT